MSFRLVAVGHPDSLAKVEDICTYQFTDVLVIKLPFQSDESLPQVSQALKKVMPHCDGILYTHVDPCKLLTRVVEHTVPLRYTEVSSSSFVHSLLYATTKYGIDIRRVSVDTLDYATIQRVYRSLEVELDTVKPLLVEVNNRLPHFVQNTLDEHQQNYRCGLCDICVTTIREVYIFLQQLGIPPVFMAPDEERYISEIRWLMLLPNSQQRPRDNVCISIRASRCNDFYVSSQPLLLEVSNLGRLTEEVALFAHQINGAMISVSSSEYVIFCSERDLKKATDNLSHLELLNTVCTNTAFTLSMGIGYGRTTMESKANADIGARRSYCEGGNRAFIVYGPGNELGPIEPNEVKHPQNAFVEHRLVLLAETAGLSIQTIFRIDCMLKTKHEKTFTALELAQALNVSHRTANRIILKLESANLLMESGKCALNGSGRPARIMKAIF